MVRAGTDLDVPSVVRLVNAAYRGIGSRPGWTHELDLLDGTRVDEAGLRTALATKPSLQLLVHDESGDLISCVMLDDRNPERWELGMLSVDPARQDRGIGRAMLADAEDMARAAGARAMRMTVIEARDALIAWYGRRGYAATEERIPFPVDDPSVGRPVRAALTLVVLEKMLAHIGFRGVSPGSQPGLK